MISLGVFLKGKVWTWGCKSLCTSADSLWLTKRIKQHLKAAKYCRTSDSARPPQEDGTILLSIPASSCFELIPTVESRPRNVPLFWPRFTVQIYFCFLSCCVYFAMELQESLSKTSAESVTHYYKYVFKNIFKSISKNLFGVTAK